MKKQKQSRGRPNIIFILSDDQGSWALGSAGNGEIRTPNLDALAEKGTRFNNFFCASPVCSPARASILTGRMPSRHGVHDFLKAGNTSSREVEPAGRGKVTEYLAGQPGYTDYLAASGYFCGISGKWHLGSCHDPQKGFGFWKVHARGGGPYYGAPLIEKGRVYREPRYVTDVITDNALEFLELAAEENSPFYLHLCYTAPHSPWGRDQHPGALYDEYHQDCPFDSVPKGVGLPPWVEEVRIPVTDEKTRRKYLSGYYASVTEMDRNIGRIIEWLEARALRENTLLIFMSDNGMNMGHHGLFGKGNASFPLNMFEESVKIPCIFSMPGTVLEKNVNEALLSQYDIMPAVLDFAGVENPEADRLPGRSFKDMIAGSSSGAGEFVVVYDEYGPTRMVRTERWKYVHRYPDRIRELYDLRNDPGEKENLAGLPGSRKKENELRGLLTEWFLKHADPARDGTKEAVTGLGQVGLAGRDSGGADNFWLLTKK